VRFPPPIVVQTNPARCGGRSVTPIAVGLVPWPEEQERTTVVAKVSYELDHATGSLLLMSPQPGFSTAEPDDLVALKPFADVMIVGHAHTAGTQDRIRAEIRIDDRLARVFSVVATAPAARIPLTVGHVRGLDGSNQAPVGPIAPRDVETDGSARPLAVSPWDGVSCTVNILDRGVQFAAAGQTCAFLDPAARIELDGLVAGGGKRVLSLPGVMPLVLYQGRHGRCAVTMVIDTLLIDTDSGRLSLVWRGQVAEDAFAAPNVALVAALADGQQVPSLTDVLRHQARGHFSRAQVPRDAGVPPAPIQDLELEIARRRALVFTPDPRMDLRQYGKIAAELACAEDRRVVLARHHMDEDEWMLEERAWLEYLASAVKAGDDTRVSEFHDACASGHRAVGVGR
jgi:hypothetical protein